MAKRMEGSAFTSWLVHGVIVLCSVGVPGAWGQGQKGFLNIDCGSTAPYVDPVTSINWVPDADYITTGLNYAGVPNAVPTYSNFSELKTLRYFNNPYPKNCYTLPVTKNDSYLLRASFYYGSYDKAAFPPSFEMSIDATVIANITTDATAMQDEEFTIRSENDVIYLCLSRDASGSVPFISAISLRPAPYYGQFETFLTTQYMRTRRRWNFGGSTMIRYPEDPSDRYWDFQGNDSSSLQQTATPIQVLTTTHPISMDYIGDLTVPSMVLETAVTTSGNLTVSSLNNESAISNAYLLLWFAELNPAANLTSREFMIEVPTFVKQYYEDAFNLSSPPSAYTADYWYFYTFGPFDPTSNIVLYPISPSTLGPILNALEFFEQTEDFSFKTNAQDVLAIDAIKSAMYLTAWTGDPCLPYPHSWIQCSSDNVPYITAIDLSNYNLATTIPPEFANLSALTSLSLDHNALIGTIPDLSALQNLKTLNIQDNMLNGSLPDWLPSLPILSEIVADNNRFTGTLNFTLYTCQVLSLVDNNITDIQPSAKTITTKNLYLGGNPVCNKFKDESVNQQRICRYNNTIIQYIVPSKDKGSRKIIVLILSISLSTLALMAIGICFLSWKIQKNIINIREIKQEFAKQEVQPILYSYSELKLATKDFHSINKLGEGGFGVVYKGTLVDGTEVAVKKLSKCSHNVGDFLNEIILLTGIKHRNLTKLKGCCLKDNHRILIYEYVENRSLAEALWGSPVLAGSLILDWPTRFSICLGIARGLIYLHEDSQPRIIHRDIKACNILLDKEWKAKIADFGLARLFPDEQSHLSTMHIAGTMGYMAPEYATRGQLTEKVDVFSFGVLILEVISGRKNIDLSLGANEIYLLEWAWNLYEEGMLINLLDSKITVTPECLEEVRHVIAVALLCIQTNANRRPQMSSVLAMLLGEMDMEVVFYEPTTRTLNHSRLLGQTECSTLNIVSEDIPLLYSDKEEIHRCSNVLELSDMTPR